MSNLFKYKPTPTGTRYHDNDDFIKMITGPYGSGKSTIVAMDLLYYALTQTPAPDNVRYTRVGVIRASYPNLIQSTRETLLQVLPEDYGSITMGSAPLRGVYIFPLGDGTTVHLEVVLTAVATMEDAEKLKSANWSFAWMNEASEMEPGIMEFLTSRVGRYPSNDMGGCSYSGILLDFNRPPPGHHLLATMADPVLRLTDEHGLEKEIPIAVFIQPPAAFKEVKEDDSVIYRANPEAENLENLRGGIEYYSTQIASWLKLGHTDYIESLFCMLDTPLRDGQAVFPQFSMEHHVAKNALEPQGYTPVIVGMDTSGIHPAATFWQENQGKWCCLDEIMGIEMGLEAFMEEALVPMIRGRYPTCDAIISCDPANARDSFTALSPTAHLERLGFRIYLPQSNLPKIRIRAVEVLLNKQVGGIMVSPTCKGVIRAMLGGYHYTARRVVSSTAGKIYNSRPEKNDDSHLADSVQYAAMYINQGEAGPTAEKKHPIAALLHRKRASLRTIM